MSLSASATPGAGAPTAARSLGRGAALTVGLAVAAAWAALLVQPLGHTAPGFAAMWAAMTLAMMVPTVLRPLRRAAAGSTGRAWAFLAGYLAVWLAVGVPGYLLLQAVAWTPAWIALAWVAAGAWHLTPLMQRSIVDCRSVPYDGRAARYGLRQGARCLLACGPLMVAVMATSMAMPAAALGLLLLVGVTALICWEKRPATGARRVAAVGIALVLLGTAGFVGLGGAAPASHHSTAAR